MRVLFLSILLGVSFIPGSSARADMMSLAPKDCAELDTFIADPTPYMMIQNKEMDTTYRALQLGDKNIACTMLRDVYYYYSSMQGKLIYCQGMLLTHPDHVKLQLYNTLSSMLNPRVNEFENMNLQLSCIAK